MGKDLTEVRSLQRKLVPDDVGLEEREPTSLQGIANRARADGRHRFQDLYRCIDVELLVHCFGELNFAAAGGVDAVTAETYGQDLESNVQALVERLKAKRYRTRLVRRSYIPKSDGRPRALGIPALEDKLVQRACGKLLSAIYEEDFLAVSYGYRGGRGAQDAVRELTFGLQYGAFGYLVEADIRGFFDNLDWHLLQKALRHHTDVPWILLYVERWLKAPLARADATLEERTKGTPQGSVISPLLSNLFMHYAFDEWLRRHFPQTRFARYAEIARSVNPIVRGWVNYYGRFYRSALTPVLRSLERSLVYWARRKFKRLRRHQRTAVHRLGRIAQREPALFELWRMGIRPATGQ